MALESAQSFVRTFYENDDFMKKLYGMGAFIGGKANDPESARAQNVKFAQVAPELGYDFSADEFDEANKAYIKGLGFFKGLKTIFHMMRVAKKAEKEMKKGK